MHLFLLSLSALVASAVSQSTSAQPGSVPTVTLPSASAEVPSGTQTVSFSATPTGSAVAVEAGEDGDVYVYFSTDTQNQITEIYKSQCGSNQDQAACEEAIGKVINSDSLEVEGRNPLVIGSLFALVLAFVMKRLEDDVNAPQVIKFNPDDYAQVSSAASLSPTALVIHDGSSTYTLTSPFEAGPKVTTLSGSGGGSVTSSKCPTTPIICQDEECLAATSATRTCEVSTNKGCPCTNQMAIETGQLYDSSSGSVQASLLMSISSAALASATPVKPSCFPNSLGSGPITASPATWCVCSQSVNPAGSNTIPGGIFSTISGKSGSDACDYSTMPSPTITISSTSTSVTATSCSLITTTITSVPSGVSGMTTGPNTWCTCNDGNQVGQLTTSLGAQTSVYCPNGPTPTISSSDPSKTTASCGAQCPFQTSGPCDCCNGPEFPRDAATQAISSVCSSLGSQPFPTPPAPYIQGAIWPLWFSNDIPSNGDNYTITLRIDNSLTRNPDLTNLLSTDSCITDFLSAMDDCDTNTVTAKRGGSYEAYSSENGMQVFNVYRT